MIVVFSREKQLKSLYNLKIKMFINIIIRVLSYCYNLTNKNKFVFYGNKIKLIGLYKKGTLRP